MVNGPHLYSAFIQSALQCWLTFTHSCTEIDSECSSSRSEFSSSRFRVLWFYVPGKASEQWRDERLLVLFCLFSCSLFSKGQQGYLVAFFWYQVWMMANIQGPNKYMSTGSTTLQRSWSLALVIPERTDVQLLSVTWQLYFSVAFKWITLTTYILSMFV